MFFLLSIIKSDTNDTLKYNCMPETIFLCIRRSMVMLKSCFAPRINLPNRRNAHFPAKRAKNKKKKKNSLVRHEVIFSLSNWRKLYVLQTSEHSAVDLTSFLMRLRLKEREREKPVRKKETAIRKHYGNAASSAELAAG